MALGPVREQREESDSRVKLLHADRLYFNQRKHPTAQFLVGNVQFDHEGTLMFCDSALFYDATNSFDAFDNVRMLQGDTLTLTGDVLYYDGLEQMARVRHNAVLTHRDITVYSDSMDYDRLFSLGYYFGGGKLIDGNTQLTSDWGEYSPETRQAVFNYNVELLTPRPPEEAKTIVISDTLYYNTVTEIAHVLGPSNIDNADNHVYTENGYYNTSNDDSYVLDRSILQNRYKNLIGDSICWSGAESIGKAFGHAIYTDTLNRNKITGNYIMYNDSIGYAEATDSAVLMDYSEGDTFYVHADSFFLHTINLDTDSMYRMLFGYHHVRAYRTDVQGVCDSVVYDGRDSCTTMYKDPILWQQGQQVIGEEIKAWRNDSTLDSIYVINQALSVDMIDSVHYNQVASKEQHTYFDEFGDPYLMVADRNVFVNYYPFDDDSLMIGMNHTESHLMHMFLVERKVNKIWMPAASGVLYPLFLIPPGELYLENFVWFDYVRPLNKDDIFNWRPKKKGTELKESVRHEPPKQSLRDVKSKNNIKDVPTSNPVSEESTISKEGSVSVESAVSEESTVSEEGSVSEESTISEEGSVSVESTVSEEGSVSEESTISEEGSVSEESTVSEEGSVSVESAVSEEGGVSEESSVSEEGGVSVESSVSVESAVSEKTEDNTNDNNNDHATIQDTPTEEVQSD